MSWLGLSTAIYDIARADTGSGGLFSATGNQAIAGWYTNEAKANAAFPYCVASLAGTTETDAFATARRAITISFRVSVLHDKRVASAHTKHEAAADRVIALLRRVAPTVSGFTVSPIMFEGIQYTEASDDVLYSVLGLYALLSL